MIVTTSQTACLAYAHLTHKDQQGPEIHLEGVIF